MTLKTKKLNQGFTLIELLVVVAIIAILALIVLLALNPVEMGRRSRDSRRLSDLGTVRRAIDLSLADGESLGTGTAETTFDSTADVKNFLGTGLNISKYLSVAPGDPYNGSTNPQTISDAACATATDVMPSYSFWSDGDVYVLRSYLESKENCAAVAKDGNPNRTYEIGTDPDLNMATP